jgi:hypothetical protein
MLYMQITAFSCRLSAANSTASKELQMQISVKSIQPCDHCDHPKMSAEVVFYDDLSDFPCHATVEVFIDRRDLTLSELKAVAPVEKGKANTTPSGNLSAQKPLFRQPAAQHTTKDAAQNGLANYANPRFTR